MPSVDQATGPLSKMMSANAEIQPLLAEITGIWQPAQVEASVHPEIRAYLVFVACIPLCLLLCGFVYRRDLSRGLIVCGAILISVATYIGMAIKFASWLCIAAPLSVLATGWTCVPFAIGLSTNGILGLYASFIVADTALASKSVSRGTFCQRVCWINGGILLLLSLALLTAYACICLRGGR